MGCELPEKEQCIIYTIEELASSRNEIYSDYFEMDVYQFPNGPSMESYTESIEKAVKEYDRVIYELSQLEDG